MCPRGVRWLSQLQSGIALGLPGDGGVQLGEGSEQALAHNAFYVIKVLTSYESVLVMKKEAGEAAATSAPKTTHVARQGSCEWERLESTIIAWKRAVNAANEAIKGPALVFEGTGTEFVESLTTQDCGRVRGMQAAGDCALVCASAVRRAFRRTLTGTCVLLQ
jgi:hypothetical protein